jgi:hypothetical protein
MIEQQRQAMAQTADAMPRHNAYIEKYCKAQDHLAGRAQNLARL